MGMYCPKCDENTIEEIALVLWDGIDKNGVEIGGVFYKMECKRCRGRWEVENKEWRAYIGRDEDWTPGALGDFSNN